MFEFFERVKMFDLAKIKCARRKLKKEKLSLLHNLLVINKKLKKLDELEKDFKEKNK